VPAGQQHRTTSLADVSLRQASSSADVSRSVPPLLGRKDPVGGGNLRYDLDFNLGQLILT
jgi:hypothetical protein